VVKPRKDLHEKAVGAQQLKRQKKTSRTATIYLEVYQPSSSSDHISNISLTLTLCFCTSLFIDMIVILQPLMQRFISLGTDCVKIQEATNASKGFSFTPRFFCTASLLAFF
jgi:hypothetical protein